MSETFDPHELVSVDLDAEEGMRRILAGGGTEDPISDEEADTLYGQEDETTDTGVLGGVDEPNECTEPLP